MTGFGKLLTSALCVALTVAAATPGSAQTSSATLTGVAVDATGGVLPGADVTIVNVSTIRAASSA